MRAMNVPAKKILIVEDDPDILLVLTAMLEDAGYTATATETGDGLLDLHEGELPDLILLDMLLSGHDGRELVRQLKAGPATAHIPVLMLSAHPAGESGARDAGADGFLPKPFEMDALLGMVAAHLA